MTEAGLQAGGGRGHRAAPPVEVELKYRLRDALAGERLLAAESIGPMRATSVTRTTQHLELLGEHSIEGGVVAPRGHQADAVGQRERPGAASAVGSAGLLEVEREM